MKKSKQIYFLKGVTLIEVMAVIAIIGVMTTIMLSLNQNSRDSARVKAAARDFASAVRSVQNDAVNGKNTSGGFGCTYSIQYGGTDYRILGCNLQGPVTLSNNVSFVGGGSVSFTNLYGKNSGGNVSINLRVGSSDYYVCVNDMGNVKEGENVNCT